MYCVCYCVSSKYVCSNYVCLHFCLLPILQYYDFNKLQFYDMYNIYNMLLIHNYCRYIHCTQYVVLKLEVHCICTLYIVYGLWFGSFLCIHTCCLCYYLICIFRHDYRIVYRICTLKHLKIVPFIRVVKTWYKLNPRY